VATHYAGAASRRDRGKLNCAVSRNWFLATGQPFPLVNHYPRCQSLRFCNPLIIHTLQ
jgi:hypothetical protein